VQKLLLASLALLAVSCGPPSTTITDVELKTFLSQYGTRFPDPGAPLTVTSVAPKYGSRTQQTGIQITGNGFELGSTATVGGVACDPIFVSTETTIDCDAQAHSAGAVDVVVTLPGGQSFTLTNGFTYL